jgi:hypothetical protein
MAAPTQDDVHEIALIALIEDDLPTLVVLDLRHLDQRVPCVLGELVEELQLAQDLIEASSPYLNN